MQDHRVGYCATLVFNGGSEVTDTYLQIQLRARPKTVAQLTGGQRKRHQSGLLGIDQNTLHVW